MLKKVNVIENPDLTQIAEEDEDISDLPAEDLLLKWVNWHLKESGSKLKMAEFSDDNSLQYLHLMHKLAPSVVTLDTVDELDSMERAEMVLQQAKKIGIESIIAPDDIVSVSNTHFLDLCIQGNEKLNLVFMAELFNKHTGFASEIDKLKEENDALRKANSTLQSELDDAHNQISLLSTKLNELSKLNIVLETEKSTFQSDLQQVTVEMRDMEVSMNRIVASKKAVHHVAEKLQVNITLFKFSYTTL